MSSDFHYITNIFIIVYSFNNCHQYFFAFPS